MNSALTLVAGVALGVAALDRVKAISAEMAGLTVRHYCRSIENDLPPILRRLGAVELELAILRNGGAGAQTLAGYVTGGAPNEHVPAQGEAHQKNAEPGLHNG